ncbi:MAG: PAS domain S-box protein [Myxococcales bacterium]|nr:PAS domain S-box protein [Myxococcales bacterium]
MRRNPIRPSYWAVFAFSVGVVISLIVWQMMADIVAHQEKELFEFRSREKISAIIAAVENQNQILFGGAGFFNASENITRNQWHTYVETLLQKMHLAGAQGLGFAQRLTPEELAEHVRQVRAEGFPGYSIRPEGERAEYTSIIYLEPFDKRNQKAFGYDMFSETVRRKAMELARDTGHVALSGKVTLLQEIDQDVQAGFLIYMPVYRTGQPISTVGERRAALYGYVYSPFRVRNFVDQIFPNGFHYTRLQIFDGPEANAQSLLFDSLGHDVIYSEKLSGPTKTEVVEVASEHKWTLRFSTTAASKSQSDRSLPLILLGIGILLSFTIGYIVWLLQISHKKAQQLQEKTSELQKSEIRYRRLFESAKDGILILDAETGMIVDVNPFMMELTGYSHEEFLDKHLWDIGPLKDVLASKVSFEELQSQDYIRYEDLPLETRDGRVIHVEFISNMYKVDKRNVIQCNIRDITARKLAEEALQKALDDVRTLRGILPICSNCKKILDDKGQWSQVEVYVRDHTEADFSHGICPDCMKELYPDYDPDDDDPPEKEDGA